LLHPRHHERPSLPAVPPLPDYNPIKPFIWIQKICIVLRINA
jgi:hypothetical protein